jgi:hypothetical protein
VGGRSVGHDGAGIPIFTFQPLLMCNNGRVRRGW